MKKYKTILIPKLDKKYIIELKKDLKKISPLDEKRVAIRQFIEEFNKLENTEFDFIVSPLFSGFIPAKIFNNLNKNKLPIFEYITLSSLSNNKIAIEKDNYKITFQKEAETIINNIKNDFDLFLKENKLDINKVKILIIDSNIAKGITIGYFIKVLENLKYNFKNLTLIITDSRANNEKLKHVSKNLLNGGKLILFNNKNMTNKVFDNVLTLSAYKKDSTTFKTFNKNKINYNKKQISFYPYFLALELLKKENKKIKNHHDHSRN